MSSTHSSHAAPVDDHDESVHHEDTDIDIKAMAIAAVALAVMTAFCYVTVYVAIGVLGKREDALSAVKNYPMAPTGSAEALPPLPRLQTDPKKELRDLRAEERAVLDSYGWVDRNGGVVRIPIDDAMRLALQRGFQSRAAAPAPAAAAPAEPAPARPVPAPAAH
jgi:hypothetical protein